MGVPVVMASALSGRLQCGFAGKEVCAGKKGGSLLPRPSGVGRSADSR